jgi:hypothetical protein
MTWFTNTNIKQNHLNRTIKVIRILSMNGKNISGCCKIREFIQKDSE